MNDKIIKVLFDKKRIKAYVLTFLPAIFAFVQLNVFTSISLSNSNYFYSQYALSFMLMGILALNTNYVFIVRNSKGEVTSSIEYILIICFRLFTFAVIITPIIIYNYELKNSLGIICFAFNRLLLESVNNYYRALNNVDILFKNILIIIGLNTLALVFIYFTKSSFYLPLIISDFIALLLISFAFMLEIKKEFFLKINLKSLFESYYTRIAPLGMSSIRENLSGQGIIYFASLVISQSSLAILINAHKVFSIGNILNSTVSNYYIQDVLRYNKRKPFEEIFLAITIFLSFIAIIIILKYTQLFNNLYSDLDFFYIALFYLGIIVSMQYTIFQSQEVGKKKYKLIYTFEFISIITFIIIFLYSDDLWLFFISSFLAFSLSLFIVNIVKYAYVRNKRN